MNYAPPTHPFHRHGGPLPAAAARGQPAGRRELTHTTAAVGRGRIALGASTAEGTGEILAPAGGAGTALRALVDVYSREGSLQRLPAPFRGVDLLPRGRSGALLLPGGLTRTGPALTTAGPAPLAAVAGLTRDALEAPGFVLAFAIRAGAGVPALVDVCTGGRNRRTGLGTAWLAWPSGSSARPPSSQIDRVNRPSEL